MSKKKIIIVIDSLNSGGAEKSLTNLLNSINLNTVDIDLLLFVKKGLYLSLVPKEVNIVEVSRKRNNIFLKVVFFILHKLRYFAVNFFKIKFHPSQLSWILTKNRYKKLAKQYDIAIAYSQGIPTYFICSKIKAIKKYSWVNTDYDNAGYNKKLDKKYYKLLDKVVCVSEKAEEVFKDKHPYVNTLVIKDIISSPLISKMSKEDLLSFNFNPNLVNILTIGRLVDVKGYDLAITAAKILKENNFKFHWYIIGEGELRAKLETQISNYTLKDCFTFVGVTPNPYPYIKKVDIYCQTSRFEGFGMAVAEAKILNKPVIATNFISAANQINSGVNGLICEMNGKSISNAIVELSNNDVLRNSIIDNLKREESSYKNEIEKVETLID